jgi:uncharacterized Ntn-hydrolase superfamily protein
VPAVGSLCPYAKGGVGAIASQSFVNPYIGINGLRYLEEGLTAAEVMAKVLEEDPEPKLRVDEHADPVTELNSLAATSYTRQCMLR